MLVKKAMKAVMEGEEAPPEEYRLVIDYRKLNAINKLDAYSLPRVDDFLDQLGKSKIFSALHMTSGFHQIPMEEDSIEMLAI